MLMYDANFEKIVYGFHGCDIETRNRILSGDKWIPSNNSYDWLGPGIYFWEYDDVRALSWATEAAKERKCNIKTPAIIGAKINLKHCLDLTNQSSIKIVSEGYEFLVDQYKITNQELPKNTNIKDDFDWKNRKLDCAVIAAVHTMNEQLGYEQYDSIRGAFIEGEPIYHGAGFKNKTHIQLCIRNTDCILELF